jgi:hypothetical protein
MENMETFSRTTDSGMEPAYTRQESILKLFRPLFDSTRYFMSKEKCVAEHSKEYSNYYPVQNRETVIKRLELTSTNPTTSPSNHPIKKKSFSREIMLTN